MLASAIPRAAARKAEACETKAASSASETAPQTSDGPASLAEAQQALAQMQRRNKVLQGLVDTMMGQRAQQDAAKSTKVPTGSAASSSQTASSKRNGKKGAAKNSQRPAPAPTPASATSASSPTNPLNTPEVADIALILINRAEVAELNASMQERRAIDAESRFAQADAMIKDLSDQLAQLNQKDQPVTNEVEALRDQRDMLLSQLTNARKESTESGIMRRMVDTQNVDPSMIQIMANEIEALNMERDSLRSQLSQTPKSSDQTKQTRMQPNDCTSRDHTMLFEAEKNIARLRVELEAVHNKLSRAIALGKSRDLVLADRMAGLRIVENRLEYTFNHSLDVFCKRMLVHGGDLHRLRQDHWVPDGSVTQCQAESCHVRFGLRQRRHHCRKCGHVFCSSHMTHRMRLSLATRMYDPACAETKVCDTCVIQAQQGLSAPDTCDFETLLDMPELDSVAV